MKTLFNFLKTTILGGVFFLLPLILIIFLLEKALSTVSKIVGPFAKVLPFSSLLGVQASYLLAIIIFIAIGFFAGLITKTGLGSRFRNSMEQFLDKLPGYSLLRVFAQDVGVEQVW